MASAVRHNAKIRYLQYTARRAHVVMLQEARRTWRAWGAFMPHGGCGGVVMLVAPAFVALYADISHEVIVKGRVHRFSFRGGVGLGAGGGALQR